ncbi:MAG: hypothetical protein ACJAVN_001820 [Roseivirga sp.]|jgi:hypothetical protein
MNTIIFIDDDSDVRATYELSMQMMFGEQFTIRCLDVEPSLNEMMQELDSIPNKVTYFVDENLKHSGRATYTGIELIKKIRIVDSKIPIYILTSTADEIEQYQGDIEFVIDKNDWDSQDEEGNLAQRFLRHINTYQDIKSEQAQRFDKLLEKSLFCSLSDEEIEEYDALNIGRSKKLFSERLISEESIQKLEAASGELNALYQQLNSGENE